MYKVKVFQFVVAVQVRWSVLAGICDIVGVLLSEATVYSMSNLKLYSVSDSPPTLAVRLGLKSLDIPYQLIDVDYAAGEHLTEEYAKKNPQKEVPCLDDNGFFLSESIVILQYLADKYCKSDSLYPRDVTQRAVVNHRLAFNLSTYYKYISEYVMGPIFFAYERTPLGLSKTNIGLSVFNTLLERHGSKYAAADHLTIADFPLVTSTMCLEAIDFNLKSYPLVEKWYSTFKREFPALWSIAEEGMKEIKHFNTNPPDLSAMNHPFHPIKKI